jgi:hypothetical protein
MTDTNQQPNNRALTLESINRSGLYTYYDGWLEYFEGTRCTMLLTAIGSYRKHGLNSFVDRSGLPQQEFQI